MLATLGLLLLPLLHGPVSVQGHANMVWPYTWFDQGGYFGMTPGMQCSAGNPGACMWFTNFTMIPGNPTLPDEMRTFQDMYIEGIVLRFLRIRRLSEPNRSVSERLSGNFLLIMQNGVIIEGLSC